MDFGAHLPVVDFNNQGYSLERLSAYVRAARELGFKAISTNDHLTYTRPWIDAPTALASILSCSGDMAIGTSVILPIVRGPIQVAKTLAALDILSHGRLFVGVGPGSSARDHEIVGLDYEERWKRFDEAILALRALWAGDGKAFNGRFYSTAGVDLEPRPLQQPTPPLWIGSWGSDAGLRRVARLGDGWLASAYNTTPNQFAEGLAKLKSQLAKIGKDPASFPNALVTMFMYISEDNAEAERVLTDSLARLIKRPIEQLRERLLVGAAETCAEKLAAYRSAGVQRVFLWPVAHELDQLETFKKKVAPLVGA